MTNASQTPENQPTKSTDPAPPGQAFWETVDTILARLPAAYVVLGFVLLVMSAQPELYIGKAGPGLAVAGGLCFVASAIGHRRS